VDFEGGAKLPLARLCVEFQIGDGGEIGKEKTRGRREKQHPSIPLVGGISRLHTEFHKLILCFVYFNSLSALLQLDFPLRPEVLTKMGHMEVQSGLFLFLYTWPVVHLCKPVSNQQ